MLINVCTPFPQTIEGQWVHEQFRGTWSGKKVMKLNKGFESFEITFTSFSRISREGFDIIWTNGQFMFLCWVHGRWDLRGVDFVNIGSFCSSLLRFPSFVFYFVYGSPYFLFSCFSFFDLYGPFLFVCCVCSFICLVFCTSSCLFLRLFHVFPFFFFRFFLLSSLGALAFFSQKNALVKVPVWFFSSLGWSSAVLVVSLKCAMLVDLVSSYCSKHVGWSDVHPDIQKSCWSNRWLNPSYWW